MESVPTFGLGRIKERERKGGREARDRAFGLEYATLFNKGIPELLDDSRTTDIHIIYVQTAVLHP